MGAIACGRTTLIISPYHPSYPISEVRTEQLLLLGTGTTNNNNNYHRPLCCSLHYHIILQLFHSLPPNVFFLFLFTQQKHIHRDNIKSGRIPCSFLFSFTFSLFCSSSSLYSSLLTLLPSLHTPPSFLILFSVVHSDQPSPTGYEYLSISTTTFLTITHSTHKKHGHPSPPYLRGPRNPDRDPSSTSRAR